MKKNVFIAIAACLLTGILQSCGGSNSNKAETDSAQQINEAVKPVDDQSSKFAVEAANGGMSEVAMGKLAQEKATNPRVKAFGTMMVNDHSRIDDALKALAATLNITLPAAINPDEQKHLDELAKKSGKDFDKEYMKMMVDDHNMDVKAFEDASQSLTNADIKAFAATTLITLKVHQDSARAIKDALK
ncbi:DUF4142 domain-containing protein [Chitinophaga sp. Cy-1792]|uniref:DUF4142 domain-containing protein n=1 Tax=Chitinophaga sp. Cy-1792 TaxID=2608339 RepID=UPI00141F6BE4|nr:DUF4142 domain-containing protein [Chitinophaga sp. Cy-1792]NIG56071.1 DUF4142 domain-containing protein [Chitinophaga sp. Cy-1792]